jgi:ABC-2 type transport system permease protein
MTAGAVELAVRRRPLPALLALALRAAQRELGFRGELLIGLLGHMFWAGATYLLWRTSFAGRSELGGLSWAYMRGYVITSFAVSVVLLTGGIDWWMGASIRTGQIAVELIQPVGFIAKYFALDVGETAVRALTGIAVLAVALAGGVIDPVPQPAELAVFLVSLVLAFSVRFFLSYLIGLLCFWTLNQIALAWARTALSNVFSGSVAPLALLPSWLGTLARFTPFRAVVYIPTTLLLGGGREHVAALLAGQLIWIAVLGAAAVALWSWSARRLVTHGG